MAMAESNDDLDSMESDAANILAGMKTIHSSVCSPQYQMSFPAVSQVPTGQLFYYYFVSDKSVKSGTRMVYMQLPPGYQFLNW